MGFIQDNTNTLEVYLTDLGREQFLRNGLATAVAYFSISDDSSNYDVFLPDPTETAPYLVANLATYNPGDVVSSGSTYYRFKIGTGSRTAPPSTWWDKLIIFDPRVIASQPIPTINHDGTLQTSLGNNNIYNDDYISDVFTQVTLRGDVFENKSYKKNLRTVKTNTHKSYVLREPDPSTSGTTITTTYIVR